MGVSETHSDLLGILFIRGDLTIYALFFVSIKLPLQAQCSRQRRPELLGLVNPHCTECNVSPAPRFVCLEAFLAGHAFSEHVSFSTMPSMRQL